VAEQLPTQSPVRRPRPGGGDRPQNPGSAPRCGRLLRPGPPSPTPPLPPNRPDCTVAAPPLPHAPVPPTHAAGFGGAPAGAASSGSSPSSETRPPPRPPLSPLRVCDCRDCRDLDSEFRRQELCEGLHPRAFFAGEDVHGGSFRSLADKVSAPRRILHTAARKVHVPPQMNEVARNTDTFERVDFLWRRAWLGTIRQN